ncbi:MAG: hypothetical protein A3G41_07650 [Elusimicrobia bacterium RIFCSPLOWO2_12_FULL_59_9]|nr:MAG: hypothetical protein A3G41_07650 [Elusimicrobia bacterium RIFCSPLOWO2_12_FULL_59_9]
MIEGPPVQAAPLRGSAPFLKTAPSLSIPMRHFAFAAAAFWLFAAAFAWGQGRLLGWDLNAGWVLGLVHILTLGWISMTMLGAMVQMAAVLWETPLAAPQSLIKAAWWLLAAGIAGFVGHLWLHSSRAWLPAVLLVAAFAIYLFALLRTMAWAPKLDWAGKHLVFAAVYLAAVAALGILLAYDRQRGVLFPDPEGALIAHVHLALVGWVSLSIFGVSYRLVSMFALSHLASKTPGRLALVLVNAGLIGLAADGLFGGRRLMPLWAALLAAGFAAYAWQMRQIFLLRKRGLDPSLSFVLLALAGGALWAALGLGLAFGWIADTTEARAAYVYAALIGWATPFILGQIHKILPFLVWLHIYSPRNWKPPVRVPKIQDLSSVKLAWAELWLLAPAVPAGIAGFLLESSFWLRLASTALFLCATVYVLNTVLTLKHIYWRDPRWSTPSS